jgi:hypothetical protein
MCAMSSDASPGLGAQQVHALHRAVDDGEGPQPEEVELDQPGGLDVVLVELRHRRLAAFFAVQRGKVGQHRGRNDHAAGMAAGVARQALERLRQVDQPAHLVLGLVEAPQLGLLRQRLVERHPYLEGDQLRDPVGEAVGVPEHASHVPHHRLRGHAAVGDDLRHAVPAIATRHVVDHPVAPVDAEIDVEVRHRDALWV